MINAKDHLKHIVDTLTEDEAGRVFDCLATHATWLFVEGGDEEDTEIFPSALNKAGRNGVV